MLDGGAGGNRRWRAVATPDRRQWRSGPVLRAWAAFCPGGAEKQGYGFCGRAPAFLMGTYRVFPHGSAQGRSWRVSFPKTDIYRSGKVWHIDGRAFPTHPIRRVVSILFRRGTWHRSSVGKSAPKAAWQVVAGSSPAGAATGRFAHGEECHHLLFLDKRHPVSRRCAGVTSFLPVPPVQFWQGAYAGKCSKAATRSPKPCAVGPIPNCPRQTGKPARKREKSSVKRMTWPFDGWRKDAALPVHMQSEAGEPSGGVLSRSVRGHADGVQDLRSAPIQRGHRE